MFLFCSPNDEIGPGSLMFEKPGVVRANDNYLVENEFNDEVCKDGVTIRAIY